MGIRFRLENFRKGDRKYTWCAPDGDGDNGVVMGWIIRWNMIMLEHYMDIFMNYFTCSSSPALYSPGSERIYRANSIMWICVGHGCVP